VASDHRLLDAQGVEHEHHVAGEVLDPIAGRRLVRVAVPTLGHSDRPNL